MRSKTDNQKRHAMRRLSERYDLNVNEHEYGSLVKAIQNNQGRFITRQSNRVTVFEIVFKQRKLIAIYDSSRQTIVTFLPEGVPDHEVGNPMWKVI